MNTNQTGRQNEGVKATNPQSEKSSQSKTQGQNFGSDQKSSTQSTISFQDRLRSQWPNFSDQDFSDIEQDNSLLSGRLEKVYGYSKDKADREYRNFMNSKRSETDSLH